MKKTRTSRYYFKYSCMDVYNAVTRDGLTEGVTITPTDESAFDSNEPVARGQMLAKVTDRTPGKSCAYELRAAAFDVHWSAEFEDISGECRMTMTETYEFHKGQVFQYILALLFIKQKEQHREYFRAIRNRLQQNAFEKSRA